MKKLLDTSLFKGEEGGLAVEAGGIAGEVSRCADDAVAGNYQGNGIVKRILQTACRNGVPSGFSGGVKPGSNPLKRPVRNLSLQAIVIPPRGESYRAAIGIIFPSRRGP